MSPDQPANPPTDEDLEVCRIALRRQLHVISSLELAVFEILDSKSFKRVAPQLEQKFREVIDLIVDELVNLQPADWHDRVRLHFQQQAAAWLKQFPLPQG